MNHRWLTFILLSLLFSNPVALLRGEERAISFEHAPPELVVDGASPEEISVGYYEIEGWTGAELRAALKKHGPSDDLGVTRDAFAGWHLTWRWPLDGNGRPDFARTTVSCTGKVTLPRWRSAPDASPELAAEWRRYSEALIRHERRHLDNCFSNRERIRNALIVASRAEPNLTAEEANSLVREHLRAIRASDMAYDSRTDHGKKEGVELRN